jgi:hypothetical protein
MVFSAAAVFDRLESNPQVMLMCGCSTIRSYIPGTAARPLHRYRHTAQCPPNVLAARCSPPGRWSHVRSVDLRLQCDGASGQVPGSGLTRSCRA